MKTLIPILAFATALPGVAQTAFTNPSGYVKIDIAANSLSSVSATLLRGVEFSGSATISADFTAASGNTPSSQTITVTGTSWSTTQWTDEPHIAFITNGDTEAAEEPFLITGSPTGTTLTLDAGSNLLTLANGSPRFPASTTITIRRANTLGSLFGTTQSDFTSADRVFLWTGTFWNEYAFNAGDWFDITNGFATATDTVVFSSEGILVDRQTATDATLTFFGDIPVKPQVSTVAGSGLTLLSNRFPVGAPITGTLLPSLNIQSLSNWGATDRVYILNNGNWTEYGFNAGSWFDLTNGFANADNLVIEPNSAIFLQRAADPTADTDNVAFELPYTIE